MAVVSNPSKYQRPINGEKPQRPKPRSSPHQPSSPRLACTYAKRYTGKRKPTCGCLMCQLKWEAEQTRKELNDLRADLACALQFFLNERVPPGSEWSPDRSGGPSGTS